jgi:hypothetical protein
LVGIVFGTFYAFTSSIFIPMLLHTMLDLRIPLMLPPERIRKLEAGS